MDPNGHIYESLNPPLEDVARLDGYRRGLAASDDDMAMEVDRMRLELARAQANVENERRARDLSDHLRIEASRAPREEGRSDG